MKVIAKFFLYIIIVLIFTIIYAKFIGTYGLITKEYPIYSSNITNDYDGLKIVHFSDLHYKRNITSKKVDEIIEEINLINPDIVVFTGDLIDEDYDINKNDIKYLKKALKKINSKYGKYTIFGNHDYKNIDIVKEIYDESEFTYLDNSYDIIYSKNKEKLFIGGLSSVLEKENNLEPFIDILKESDINYKIFLIHEPDITDDILKEYNIDLILAGHSHNGQIRLPFVGALYKREYAKKYYDEYYKINNTDLYISSGIGVSKVDYRLFNHPSINFYRIYKENSQTN